jgi:hypothetical protein
MLSQGAGRLTLVPWTTIAVPAFRLVFATWRSGHRDVCQGELAVAGVAAKAATLPHESQMSNLLTMGTYC